MSQRSFSFSIFFSLLGVGVGLTLLGASLLTSVQTWRQLYQPRGFAFIVGGLCLVLICSGSLDALKQRFLLIWRTLSAQNHSDMEALMRESIMLATRSRESESEQKFWREIRPYLSQEILQTGLEFLSVGYGPDLISSSLRNTQIQREALYQETMDCLNLLARASWMLGLAAAAMGLLRTQFLADPSTFSLYMGAIATPAVAGVVLSQLIFMPIYHQLKTSQNQGVRYSEMAEQAILLLQERHHGLYIETVLKAFLPSVKPLVPVAPLKEKTRPVFQQVLQEQEDELPQELGGDGKALSVDELRRFRPVQKPGDKKAK